MIFVSKLILIIIISFLQIELVQLFDATQSEEATGCLFLFGPRVEHVDVGNVIVIRRFHSSFLNLILITLWGDLDNLHL